jgi:MoxR-like ATPase
MANNVKGTINLLDTILLGKHGQIKLAMACLLAEGHLLIEDLPGLGKTTLSHALANVLGLSYNRIQFTSDLLPSDLTGITIYERSSEKFIFQRGPIFAQVVLADEINRASPKCQSALLEAMEERQVSIDGETHQLPAPFFVIATQNPQDQAGTFPLPESQLDRFLMRITLGYPPAEAEKSLLKGNDRRQMISGLTPLLGLKELEVLQAEVRKINASDAIIDYVHRLLHHTRNQPQYHCGLSPRAGLALLKAAKAWALIAGRDYVLPEDIQAVLPSVVEHRVGRPGAHHDTPLSRQLLKAVDVF